MRKYRNLLMNTGLFALNAVATRLFSFVLIPLYTACMSTGDYGLTDMSATVISLVTPLATLSIADAVVRYIVSDRGKACEFAAISFVITAFSVAIVAAFTPVLSFSVFGGLDRYSNWFILAYSTSAFLSLCGQVARGINKVKIIPFSAAVSSVVTLILALYLIGICDLDIVGYFASLCGGQIAAMAVYLLAGGMVETVVKGFRSLVKRKGRFQHLRQLTAPMLKYALPLIPNTLFWWVGTSINRFFITGMLGIGASGMFAAAGKIPNLLNMAYSVFQQAWQLSAFQESGNEGLEGFFSSVFRILQASMTVLCAVLSFLAPWIAAVFLQGEFYDAWPMISILLIANLMNVFNSFYGTVYTTTMHTSYIMRTTVVGALSCMVLTPALIVLFDTYGACAASAVGNTLVFAMRARDSRKYIRFDAGWRTLVPTLALLVIQSVATAVQVPGWQVVSGACFVVCVALQGSRLLPLVRNMFGRLLVSQKESGR